MKKILKMVIALVIVFATVFCVSPLANAALYTPETCPQFKNYGAHRFDISKCYYCDYACPHKDKLMLNEDNSWGNPYETVGDKHYQRWQCKTCNTYGNVAKGQACKFEYSKESPYHDYHTLTCKVCGNKKTENCVYKMVYKGDNDRYHTIKKVCKICKGTAVLNKTSSKHTYKNNKCSVCGFVRVIPGNVKVKSIKCVSRKKVVRKFLGYWDDNWNWHPPTTRTEYVYTIKVKLKKAKNAKVYGVTDQKDVFMASDKGNRMTSKKTSFTYKYTTYYKPAKKATLYVAGFSKTDTASAKPTKKVVKLKN